MPRREETPVSVIEPALVRAAEAEVLQVGATRMALLADAGATGGAVNACRTHLPAGTHGAPPHHHSGAAELFFVLDGALEALAGSRLLTLGPGDFLLVPRGVPHAFAAPAGTHADVLLVFIPGLADRFGYFRLAAQDPLGEADPAELLATQQRYDNHFVDSPLWRARRDG
jgi:mannose-6-phosphate isomerase-like protein (cupin superfamily)